MEAFFDALGVPCPVDSTIRDTVAQAVWPAVVSYFEKHSERVQSIVKQAAAAEGRFDLAGDARYDSRGYTARICTYTMLDVRTSLIVGSQVLDKKIENGSVLNPVILITS